MIEIQGGTWETDGFEINIAPLVLNKYNFHFYKMKVTLSNVVH